MILVIIVLCTALLFLHIVGALPLRVLAYHHYRKRQQTSLKVRYTFITIVNKTKHRVRASVLHIVCHSKLGFTCALIIH